MTTVSHGEAQLHAEAVDVLTRAAEYAQAHRETFDYAGFIARALHDTATFVGGTEMMLGERTESWEAHHVTALTWTYSPDTAITRDPMPVVVPVNVAQLIENDELHPGLLGMDAAIDQIGYRYANVSSEDDLNAWDDEVVATEARYHREYQAYLDRFGAAAQAASEEMGLPAGIYLAATANPGSGWWTEGSVLNPREGVDSDVVRALWNYAHDSVQLPNVDLAYEPPDDRRQYLSRGA